MVVQARVSSVTCLVSMLVNTLRQCLCAYRNAGRWSRVFLERVPISVYFSLQVIPSNSSLDKLHTESSVVIRTWSWRSQPAASARTYLREANAEHWHFESRVFIENSVGIPRMKKLLYSTWKTLSITFALTPIGQLHQSPHSPVPGDLGRCPSPQSHLTRT